MKHCFLPDFHRERRTIIIIFVIEVIILICSLGMTISDRDSFWLATLTLTGLGILLLIISTNSLYRRYSKLPIVVEKTMLLGQFAWLNREIERNLSAIRKATNRRKQIKKMGQSKIKERETRYDKYRSKIADARKKITSLENQEIEFSLDKIQTQYLESALQKKEVRHAQINGIGPELKAMLERNGIHHAGDVTFTRVWATKGFRISETQSVIEWRQLEERLLRSTMPRKIPRELKRSIQQRYKVQQDQIFADDRAAMTRLEQDLLSITKKVKSRLAQNKITEDKAQERLVKLRPLRDVIGERFEPYQSITFWKFIRSVVAGDHGGAKTNLRFLLGAIIGGTIVTLFWQSVVGLGSGGTIPIASIPTATSTVTPTLSPDSTVTSTATTEQSSTPSLRFIPTTDMTQTPTPTLEETRLPLATPSRTPQPTPTNKPTVAPTATRRPEGQSGLKFASDYENQKIEGFHDSGMTISNEHARNGNYSLRVYLQRGSERTELRITEGGDKFEVVLGVEHWIGLSYFLPASFVPDVGGGYGDLVLQIKGIPDADEGEAWNLNPIVALYLMGDKWQITNRWDSNRVTVKGNYQGQLIEGVGMYAVNRWTDVVLQYLPSYGGDGVLKLWIDGTLVFERNGPNCFNDKHGPAIDYGIYKWHWKPGNTGGDNSIQERLLFIDEVRVATGPNKYNLVNPAGY